MAGLTPEGARGWLQTILALTNEATSVTLVFMLLTGGVFGFYMLKELGRTRDINYELWQRLLAAEKQTVDMAWRCAQPVEGR